MEVDLTKLSGDLDADLSRGLKVRMRRAHAQRVVPVGDPSDRTVRFIASTDGLKKDRIALDNTGWNFRNFARNPAMLWCHKMDEPPLGHHVAWGTMRLPDGRWALWNEAKFATADEYPFADTIYRMVTGNHIRGESVSWDPDDDDEKLGPAYVPLLDKSGRKIGWLGKRNLLTEITVCPLGLDPEALATARSRGLITPQDFDRIIVPAERRRMVDEVYVLSALDGAIDDIEWPAPRADVRPVTYRMSADGEAHEVAMENEEPKDETTGAETTTAEPTSAAPAGTPVATEPAAAAAPAEEPRAAIPTAKRGPLSDTFDPIVDKLRAFHSANYDAIWCLENATMGLYAQGRSEVGVRIDDPQDAAVYAARQLRRIAAILDEMGAAVDDGMRALGLGSDEGDEDGGERMLRVGKKIARKRLERLKVARDEVTAVIDEAEAEMSDKAEKEEERTAPAGATRADAKSGEPSAASAADGETLSRVLADLNGSTDEVIAELRPRREQRSIYDELFGNLQEIHGTIAADSADGA